MQRLRHVAGSIGDQLQKNLQQPLEGAFFFITFNETGKAVADHLQLQGTESNPLYFT
ncbi:MAG: hypothetical protein ACKO7B_16150 [Flavobacteriales bacterium]